MKSKFFIVPVFTALAFAGCKKQPACPPSINNDVTTVQFPVNASREAGQLYTGSELLTYLTGVDNVAYDETSRYSEDGLISEGSRVYHINKEAGEVLSMSIGDYKNSADLLRAFAKGKGIFMSSPAAAEAGLAVTIDAQASQLMIANSVEQGVINFSMGQGAWDPNGLADLLTNSSLLTASAGSFIKPYVNAGMPDVQGWEIYDNSSATAMIILVVHRRYAVLIEHTAATSTRVALSKFTNVQGLEKRR